MKKTIRWMAGTMAIVVLVAASLVYSDGPGDSHGAASSGPTRSMPGQNEWNRGREPQDWWGEMLRYHGHVGPWNVVGWRIGKAAMRELKAEWGDHTLDILVHLPLTTPYTCLTDGLTVSTGNSIGRLDIRLAEELTSRTLHVSVRSKTTGAVLEFWPQRQYLRQIESRPPSQLESLSRETVKMDEKQIFELRRL